MLNRRAHHRSSLEDRRVSLRLSPLALALCLLALLSCAAWGKDKSPTAYRGTPEWTRVVALWHLLTDHSQGVIYSPERFKEVAPRVDQGESDLRSLANRGLLSRDAAEGVTWVLRARYEYVRDRCYGVPATGDQEVTEAPEAASHWVVEMQLGLLRQQVFGSPLEMGLLDAIRGNLTTELTFLRSLRALDLDLSAKEQTASKEDDKNGSASAKRIQESLRRRQQLLDAYDRHKLPRDRTVEGLIPYVMELTETAPDHSAAALPATPAPK